MSFIFKQQVSSLDEEAKLKVELDLSLELPRPSTSHEIRDMMESTYLETQTVRSDKRGIRIPNEQVNVGNFYLCVDSLDILNDDWRMRICIGVSELAYTKINHEILLAPIIRCKDIIYEDDQVKIPLTWFDMFKHGLFPLYKLEYHSLTFTMNYNFEYRIQYDTYLPHKLTKGRIHG